MINSYSIPLLTSLLLTGTALAQPTEPGAPPQPEAAPAEPTAAGPTTESAAVAPSDSKEEASDPSAPPAAEPEKSTPAENTPAAAAPAAAASPKPAPEEPKKEEPYTGPGTIFGGSSGKVHIGGYGGFGAYGTTLNEQAGLLLGGGGALLIDHRLAIGLAGYGLVTEVTGPDFPSGNRSLFAFGYGGLTLRYHFIGKSPFSASVGGLLGGGALTLVEQVDVGEFIWDEEHPIGDGFLVVEPQIQIHANFTRWMRLTVSGSYRIVNGVSAYGFDESDLRGMVFGGALEFGRF